VFSNDNLTSKLVVSLRSFKG